MGRELSGKTAIVTGASSGIGESTALALAKRGVNLTLAARREERLREVAEAAELFGVKALAIKTDVGSESDILNMVSKTIESFGGVDILINNAGYGQFSLIEDTTSEEMRNLLDVNYMGTFYASRAVIPHMKKNKGGHIISISSVAGHRSFPFLGAYSVSKFAQKALAEALRIELADTGIEVSIVCPTITDTEFFKALKNKTDKAIDAPKFFTQTPEKVASSIIKCLENPKPEVWPFPLAKLLIVLNSLSPGLVDFILRRYYKNFVSWKDKPE